MLSYIKITYPYKTISRFLCLFLLTINAFLFLNNTASAQNSKEAGKHSKFSDSLKLRLEIGISAGLSLSKFTKGQPQTGSNTGYTAGISVNYKLEKGVSFQLEVNALQQGGRMIRFKDDTRYGLPESFETKNVKNSSYTLNSIEVPLLINYTFKIKPLWKPSLYIGGSYTYTYNVNEKYQKTGNLLPGEDIIATVSNSQNATNLFNTSRLNLIVGANLKLPLTSRFSLLVDMRYLNGLTTAREKYSYMDKIGFGTNIRTNSFLTKLGIVMPLSALK
ncbi:PorT family protein [Pedobacter sp. PAMC26386]|nr:PorT family protein [Pedobacter sp. PAMC26386]